MEAAGSQPRTRPPTHSAATQACAGLSLATRAAVVPGEARRGGRAAHCTSMLGGVVSTTKEAVTGVPWLPTSSTAYTAGASTRRRFSRKVILWERPGCGMSRPQQEGAGQAAVQAGSPAPSHERGAALVTTPGGQVSLPDVRPLPTGKDIGAVGQVAEGSRGGAWGIGRGVCRRRRRRRARVALRQPAVVRGAAGKHQMF